MDLIPNKSSQVSSKQSIVRGPSCWKMSASVLGYEVQIYSNVQVKYREITLLDTQPEIMWLNGNRFKNTLDLSTEFCWVISLKLQLFYFMLQSPLYNPSGFPTFVSLAASLLTDMSLAVQTKVIRVPTKFLCVA